VPTVNIRSPCYIQGAASPIRVRKSGILSSRSSRRWARLDKLELSVRDQRITQLEELVQKLKDQLTLREAEAKARNQIPLLT
jgi:hypothetical protein